MQSQRHSHVSTRPAANGGAPSSAEGTPISAKALVVGVLLCLVISLGEPFGVGVLRTSPMCADFSTGGAVFVFFLLVFVVNSLLRRFLPGAALNQQDLLVCYMMMIIASAIPSWGFTMNLLPLMAAPYYYATASNRWVEEILPNLPKAFLMNDREAAEKFFLGLKPGEAIPWQPWVRPLLLWSALILSVYFLSVCLMVILRKQWVERERLTYPLMQLPIDMVDGIDEPGSKAVPRFFRDPVMWIGFLIPAIVNSFKALHAYYPFIPAPTLGWTVPIFDRAWNVQLRVFFEVIGLSYLLNLDVGLSIWVFALLANLQQGYLNRVGFSIGPQQAYSDPGGQEVSNQALGAMVVLVVLSLWTARRHLRDVFASAFGRREIDDSDEAISYRTAVFGTIVCLIALEGFLVLSGLNALTAAIFIFWALVVFLGLTRIICQAGLAYARAPVIPAVATIDTLGTAAIGPHGIGALGMTAPWAMDTRTMVMASTANGLKLADLGRMQGRRTGLAILLAIVVSLAASMIGVLVMAYHHGGGTMGGWGFSPWYPRYIFGGFVRDKLQNPVPRGWYQFLFMAIGGVGMVVLTWMRTRFIAWPLHPVGFALGLTHPIHNVWFSVAIAWLLKALIVRYGGPKTYRRLRPFFLGLILGGFAAAGFWIILSAVFGVQVGGFTLG